MTKLLQKYPSGTAPMLLGDIIDQTRLPDDETVMGMCEACGLDKTEPMTIGILREEWDGHPAGSGVIIHYDDIYILGN